MLRSPISGDEMEFNRISLVTSCGFCQEKIAQGQPKLHARDIPDSTTDAEWLTWLTAAGG